MPSGLSRPYGHQGLVDDGTEGSTPPSTPDFLSTIYAAGLADDPAVDNLMTGPLQRFFINLGSTPPPFPPNAQPFFPEAALFVGEDPADTGVGSDSKPLWRMQRHFSTFPSLGDQIYHETKYDLFPGGVNAIYGGDRNLHVLIDQFDNRLTFAIDSWQLTRPGLAPANISPTYLDGSPVSFRTWALMDAVGGGNTNDWHISSDGNMFRRGLIPNVAAGGGGPPGPWALVADNISMWSRNGGEPLVGSELYYDVLDAQTFGIDDPLVDQHVILASSVVLDAKNLGSGQAAGHANWRVRSTLGGPIVLVGQAFDNGFVFPVGFGSSSDGAITGNLDVSGTLSTSSLPADAMIQGVMASPLIDFLAAPATYALSPNFPGRYFLPIGIRYFIDQINGTITTGPTDNIGNNGAATNVLANAIHVTGANINAINTAGQPGYATGIAPVVGVHSVDCTTPHSVQITAAAVAGTATICKGRVFLAGFWITP